MISSLRTPRGDRDRPPSPKRPGDTYSESSAIDRSSQPRYRSTIHHGVRGDTPAASAGSWSGGTRYTRRRGSGVPRRPARTGGDMHPVEQQSRRSMVVRRDHPNCNNKNSSVGHLTRPPVVARSTAAADTERPAPTCGGAGRVIADQSLARKAATIGSTRCAWRAVAPGQEHAPAVARAYDCFS